MSRNWFADCRNTGQDEELPGTWTFAVTVTMPPGGSPDAGDYACDLAEATSALGFEVGPFRLVSGNLLCALREDS